MGKAIGVHHVANSTGPAWSSSPLEAWQGQKRENGKRRRRRRQKRRQQRLDAPEPGAVRAAESATRKLLVGQANFQGEEWKSRRQLPRLSLFTQVMPERM
ncbi:UNVERIFIED_CONTAM: hypothetical protein K2H54_046584 [Gekko kuhli]